MNCPNSARGSLALRVVSAVVLAPVALGLAYLGGVAFVIVAGAVAALMIIEWHRLTNASLVVPVAVVGLCATGGALACLTLLGAWPALAVVCAGALASGAVAKAGGDQPWFAALGCLIVGLALVATLWLRADDTAGRATLYWLFAVVWASDIGAYAVGRLLGGPRLAPRISPGKTWAGALGGLAAAAGGSVLLGWLVVALGWVPASLDVIVLIGAGLLGSVLAQSGDLLESWLKRRAGAKDSGAIIPGHGGVFDRLDSFVLPVLALAVATLLAGGATLWSFSF